MSHIIVNPNYKLVERTRAEASMWEQSWAQREAFVALYQYQYPVNLRHFGRKTTQGLIMNTLLGDDPAKYPVAFISYMHNKYMISSRKSSAEYIEVLATSFKGDNSHLIACISTLKDVCKGYDIFVSPYKNEAVRDAFMSQSFVPFYGIDGETAYAKTINTQFKYEIRQTLWLKA